MCSSNERRERKLCVRDNDGSRSLLRRPYLLPSAALIHVRLLLLPSILSFPEESERGWRGASSIIHAPLPFSPSLPPFLSLSASLSLVQ